MEFEQYCWASAGNSPQSGNLIDHNLIDDLFFGSGGQFSPQPKNSSNNSKDMENNEVIGGGGGFSSEAPEEKNERIRRVTLTELTDSEGESGCEDEDEDWLMVSDESGSENEDWMSSEDIFKALDEAVHDWKSKLEVAVGEGLKRLRRSTKDNKLKMQYLPGERCGNKKLLAAKNSIVKDWNDDFEIAIRGVQAKLEKLTRDKIGEVNALCGEKLMSKGTSSNNTLMPCSPKKTKLDMKKKITIDCRENAKKSASNEATPTYPALKQMVRELDRMVAATAQTTMDMNCVPIYNMNMVNCNATNGNANIVATPYEFPFQKYLKYLKEQQQQKNSGVGAPVQNPKPNFNINQFMANNKSNNTPPAKDQSKAKPVKEVKPILKETTRPPTTQKAPTEMKKEVRRETSALFRQEKMKERHQTRRKKGEATITNQGTGYTYRLRQYSVNGEEHTLIVRKKIPGEVEEVEDIFKAWNHNLDNERRKGRRVARKLSHRAQRKEFLKQHSYPKVTGPASYADALKKNLKFRPNYIPVEDVFETWKDLLADPEDLVTPSTPTAASTECGQPTVKVAAITEQMRPRRAGGRRRGILQPENYFAGWRFNFDSPQGFLPRRRPKIGRNYAAEEYFRDWKKNLYTKEASYPKKVRQLERLPENIFNDWLHNFNVHYTQQRPGANGGPRNHPKKHHAPPPPTPPASRHRNSKSSSDESSDTSSPLPPTKQQAEPLANKSRSNNQRRSKNKKGSKQN